MLDKITSDFSPVAMSLLLAAAVAAVIMCVIGFGQHGMDFIKHGFKQTMLAADLDSRFNSLAAKIDVLGNEIGNVRTELRNEISGVRSELGSVKSELRNEISSVKSELRNEINGVKTELGNEISSVKSELGNEISSVKTELDMIKVNHFGHLKNYLGVLNSILLDQKIISNESKARLDNELRGM